MNYKLPENISVFKTIEIDDGDGIIVLFDNSNCNFYEVVIDNLYCSVSFGAGYDRFNISNLTGQSPVINPFQRGHYTNLYKLPENIGDFIGLCIHPKGSNFLFIHDSGHYLGIDVNGLYETKILENHIDFL